ncbi:hypothetical protein Poly30_43220 [Planctomycetes bacterium Poly30]|uniref:AlgX/AlgJ SGNH hydrolase-like domain-containing protein n=1 Tax=Saltatorellus ferox TaxID=2528018 RepID=A0A518EXH1_9BACT|nr:hypothetical protein Poly30_43220 [Planctomycetes bacterium Poly30]
MRWIDRLLGGAFLGALAAPGLLSLHHGERNAERTAAIIRRRPTPTPSAPRSLQAAAAFPHGFDAWLNDAWGGREAALRTNARLSMELFGTSPAPDLFFGKDTWVFSGAARAMESFTGTDPLSPEDLAAWQRALEDRREWLAARGIDHLVVLVPHKSTIYPEKLPSGLQEARGTSRREQFLAWMHEHSDLRILDIAPALLAAKPAPSTGDTSLRDLYSPHGVHWAQVGAFAAYAQIVGYLAEHHGAPPAHSLADYEVRLEGGEGDSWASRMLLDGVIEMKNLRLEPRAETGVSRRPAPGGTAKDFQFQHPDATRPRIVIAHDSFGPDIRERIAEHASLMETRWRAWLEKDVVERVKPDVVIELYSELSLVTSRPFRRPEFLGPGIAGRFEEGALLQSLDVTEDLEFEGRPDKSQVRIEGGAARIELLRGVCRLRLPALARPAPADTELILRVDLRSKVHGSVGLYAAKELTGPPEIGDMVSVEVGPGTRSIHVPLLDFDAGSRIWFFLPPNLEEVTLRGAEIRACPR